MNTFMVVPSDFGPKGNERGILHLIYSISAVVIVNTGNANHPRLLQEGLALCVVRMISSMTSASGGCLGDKRR